MALISSKLAKRFQYRLLLFVLVLVAIQVIGGLLLLQHFWQRNLKQQAMAMDDLIAMQMDWMHRNAPIYTQGNEGVVTGTGPDGLFLRLPEMIIQQWGTKGAMADDLAFSLVSHWPLNKELEAQGKVRALLEQFEANPQSARRQWWREDDHYVMFRPMANNARCQGCHGEQNKAFRGGIRWNIPTTLFREARTWSLAGAILLGIGGMACLFLLLNRFFAVSVTQPLNQLRDMADKVSHGQFDTEFDYRREDEIQEVGQSVIRLKKSLQLAMKKLKKDMMH